MLRLETTLETVTVTEWATGLRLMPATACKLLIWLQPKRPGLRGYLLTVWIRKINTKAALAND